MRAFFYMYQEPQRSTVRSLKVHHIIKYIKHIGDACELKRYPIWMCKILPRCLTSLLSHCIFFCICIYELIPNLHALEVTEFFQLYSNFLLIEGISIAFILYPYSSSATSSQVKASVFSLQVFSLWKCSEWSSMKRIQKKEISYVMFYMLFCISEMVF